MFSRLLLGLSSNILRANYAMNLLHNGNKCNTIWEGVTRWLYHHNGNIFREQVAAKVVTTMKSMTATLFKHRKQVKVLNTMKTLLKHEKQDD